MLGSLLTIGLHAVAHHVYQISSLLILKIDISYFNRKYSIGQIRNDPPARPRFEIRVGEFGSIAVNSLWR